MFSRCFLDIFFFICTHVDLSVHFLFCLQISRCGLLAVIPTLVMIVSEAGAFPNGQSNDNTSHITAADNAPENIPQYSSNTAFEEDRKWSVAPVMRSRRHSSRRRTDNRCRRPSPFCGGDGVTTSSGALCSWTMENSHLHVSRLPETLYQARCRCALPHVHRYGEFALECEQVRVITYVVYRHTATELTPITTAVGCTVVKACS